MTKRSVPGFRRHFLHLSPRLVDLTGLLVFGLVAVALGYRITRGIDFGDEAYYAQFVAEWLKHGVADSPFRTLHQTAALTVYPASRLFVALQGSSDGLFLFLRSLFLAGSIVAALLWYAFMRLQVDRQLAWPASILILGFIPFGLPAPSYNTIGMQAAIAAIACLGISDAMAASPPTRMLALVGSALAWALAATAYPPLGAVAAALVLVVLIAGEAFSGIRRGHVVLIAIAVAAAAIATIVTLSPTTMLESINYLNTINRVDSLTSKLEHTIALLQPYPVFCFLLFAASVSGLFRNRLGPIWHPLVLTTLQLAMYARDPALYIRSHDAILLVAVGGLGILADLRLEAPRRRRLIAVCYLLTMSVAAVTTASALHTFYNFCIGGLPAAALALGACYRQPAPAWPRQMAMMVLATIVLSTSLLYRYGQTALDTQSPKVRVESGVFKGLAASSTMADLLSIVRKEIAPAVDRSTLAVFSESHPGVALEMPLASLRMLTTFPLPADISAAGLSYTYAYYADPANRPRFVLVFREGGREPVNPMQPSFDTWYQWQGNFESSYGALSLYRLR